VNPDKNTFGTFLICFPLVCLPSGAIVGETRKDWGTVMQIVDAQIHAWGTGLPSNMSHRQVTSYTPAEAIAMMDEGGVDAAVIHPPGWDPGSTDMAFKAVRDYPNRFAILGSVKLEDPASRDRIATWRDQPGMLGLRYTCLHEPMRTWIADGTLAKHPNIGVKVTGAPGYSAEAYPFPTMQGYVRQIFDAFGPRRTFWGTDITKMPCSWRQCVTMFTEAMPWMTEQDKEQVMGKALCAWWGWERGV
jgi:predicted TIM-barrel fold metal-dependent hydrolase